MTCDLEEGEYFDSFKKFFSCGESVYGSTHVYTELLLKGSYMLNTDTNFPQRNKALRILIIKLVEWVDWICVERLVCAHLQGLIKNK
jgi:hypothetical protein